MKIDRHYKKRTKEEIADDEMQDEINEQIKLLQRYEDNLKSILDEKRAKEVRKAMINFLVERL